MTALVWGFDCFVVCLLCLVLVVALRAFLFASLVFDLVVLFC